VQVSSLEDINCLLLLLHCLFITSFIFYKLTESPSVPNEIRNHYYKPVLPFPPLKHSTAQFKFQIIMSVNNSGNLSNRYASSYQQGTSYQNTHSAYQPPASAGQTYVEQQTNVLHDTVKTQYQTEATAQTVLSQLNTQRHQLGGAADDVWNMRIATEQAKRELEALKNKHMAKKKKLYMVIAALGTVDLLLFCRIVQCHGSFICW